MVMEEGMAGSRWREAAAESVQTLTHMHGQSSPPALVKDCQRAATPPSHTSQAGTQASIPKSQAKSQGPSSCASPRRVVGAVNAKRVPQPLCNFKLGLAAQGVVLGVG